MRDLRKELSEWTGYPLAARERGSKEEAMHSTGEPAMSPRRHALHGKRLQQIRVYLLNLGIETVHAYGPTTPLAAQVEQAVQAVEALRQLYDAQAAQDHPGQYQMHWYYNFRELKNEDEEEA